MASPPGESAERARVFAPAATENKNRTLKPEGAAAGWADRADDHRVHEVQRRRNQEKTRQGSRAF